MMGKIRIMNVLKGIKMEEWMLKNNRLFGWGEIGYLEYWSMW